MGLLKGVGRDLKGLFRDGGLADSLRAAQAFLEGDYGTAMSLGEQSALRRRERRRARAAQEEAEGRARASAHEVAHAGAIEPGIVEGTIERDPQTGRRFRFRNGRWEPWGL